MLLHNHPRRKERKVIPHFIHSFTEGEVTSIQIEKRKLYAIDLSLLSLKTIFLSFARSDDHQTVSWIQFISQAWQTTNVEKCEYFSVPIELAQPSISWAPKHVKRRKAPGAERGVKERKDEFAFFLTAVDNFIQRPYQRRELNLFSALYIDLILITARD